MLPLFFLLACVIATAVKRNRAAIRLGAASMLLELGFAALWFPAQVRNGESWLALAFNGGSGASVMVWTVMVCNLVLIAANALRIYYRQYEGDSFDLD